MSVPSPSLIRETLPAIVAGHSAAWSCGTLKPRLLPEANEALANRSETCAGDQLAAKTPKVAWLPTVTAPPSPWPSPGGRGEFQPGSAPGISANSVPALTVVPPV